MGLFTILHLMNSPTKDLTPVNPKKLRGEYAHALRANFILGLLIPLGVSGMFADLSAARFIYQDIPCVITSLILLLLILAIQNFCTPRTSAIIAYPIFALATIAALYCIPTFDACNYAPQVMCLMLSGIVLLNFARSQSLSMGPAKTNYQRISLSECFLPLGVLVGCGLAALSTIPTLAGLGFLPTLVIALLTMVWAFVKLIRSPRPDLTPWQQDTAVVSPKSAIFNWRSIISLSAYLISASGLAYACAYYAKNMESNPNALYYGAGLAAIILICRVFLLKNIGNTIKKKSTPYYLVWGVVLVIACSYFAVFLMQEGKAAEDVYGLLLSACACFSSLAPIVIPWTTQPMSEKQTRTATAFFNIALLLAFYIAIQVLSPSLASCGHFGCTGG